MKMLLLLSPLFFVAAAAQASSGQWERELLRAGEKLAVAQELKASKADEVQVLDSYIEGAKVFVTVGPEKGGRAARIYHCWTIQYAHEVGDDSVLNMSRVYGKTCPKF